MERPTLWSRVTRWFHHEGGRSRRRADADTPDDPSSGILFGARSAERAGTDGTGRAWSARASVASRGDARDAGPASDRFTSLMAALEAHWRVQDQHLDTVTRRADRLVAMVELAVGTLEKQATALTRIADSTSVSAVGIQRLEEKTASLPAWADAQRDTLVSIGRRLDEWRGAAEETAQAMHSIRQTLTQLAETAATSAQVLQQMREADASRERHLTALVQEQTRRLTMFGWWIVGWGAAVLAVGLIALFR